MRVRNFLFAFIAISFFSAAPLFAHADAYKWTDQTLSGVKNWGVITSSSDGVKLAAGVFGGDIWTSTDSGVHWTDQTLSGSRQWQSITSSSDGTKLAALVGNGTAGSIYTSTDSGVHWTAQAGAGSRHWTGIASSADGTKLAATGGADFNTGDIWTSTTSGVTWTDQTLSGARTWQSITSSSDGTKLAAMVDGGDIWTSTDSGAHWTDQTLSGARSWWRITSSSDGTKLAASIYFSGDIWTSADSGVHWTDQSGAGTRYWGGITSSADGTRIAAVESGNNDPGHIVVSLNSGGAWSDQASPGAEYWGFITSSSDNAKIAATFGSGDIWTGALIVPPTLSTTTVSNITPTGITFSASTTADGFATTTIEGFNYGTTTAYGSVASTTGTFSLGPYSQTVTGLSCATSYHVQAFAVNQSGTGTSSDMTFSTSACPVVPTVTAQSASGITEISVTLNGTITQDGGASSTIRGFAYGTAFPYTATTTETGTFGIGPFTATLSSLVCNTMYHFAPYSVNTAGTSAYPADTTFTTNACTVAPVPSAGGYPSGGSVSSSVLASLLAPSPEATAYLQSRGISSQTVISTPTTPASSFPRTLTLGTTDPEVKSLQIFLNTHGFTLVSTGPGSPMHETSYFGPATFDALKRFQAFYASVILAPQHLTRPTGFFGEGTRGEVDNLLN